MNRLSTPHRTERHRKLWRLAQISFAVVMVKTFLFILWEYRLYFPADFESPFLSGRRYTFLGAYRWNFYVHIISAPVALALGTALIFTGQNRKLQKAHRIVGRVQILIVLFVVTPTGLMLAQQAYAGLIATWAFSMQSIVTALCAIATIRFAMNKQVDQHEQWAKRCYVLLCTPLIFRLVSGAAIVARADSESLYQWNSWLSWLLPMVAFEFWNQRKRTDLPTETTRSTTFSNAKRLSNEC